MEHKQKLSHKRSVVITKSHTLGIFMKNEGLNLDTITRFRKYGSVQIATAQKETAKKVMSRYMHDLQYVRGTYMMEMYVADETLKRTVPTLSFFKGMFTEPAKIFLVHSAMFNQKLLLHMQTLIKEPQTFASIVVPFLIKKPDQIHRFAYGVFPSFYGYFIGAEFCECAIDFLSAVFKEQNSQQISEALLASFFCSCHAFYDCLWQNLASGLMEMTPNTYNFFKILNTVKVALEKSLPFLSPYHIQIFSSFCAAFPKNCSRYLIETILVKQFIHVASSSVCFTSASQTGMLMTFLQELMKPMRMLHNEDLLNMVITYKGSLNSCPSMNLRIWSKGIPIIMNDCDIKLLVEILSSGTSKIKFHRDQHESTLSDTFRPCLMDVFVPARKNEKSSVIEDLFGITPPTVHSLDDEDEEFSRTWREMLRLARSSNEIVIDFLMKKAGSFEGEFGEFFVRRILSVFGENFMTIQDTILLAEHLSHFQRLSLSIVSHNVSLYHGFFYDFFRKEMSRTLSLKKTIRAVTGDIELPKTIGFEISCIVLDCAAFPVSKQMKKAQNRFVKLVDKWMENEWPKYQQSCKFANRIKYVLETVTVFNQIEYLGLGKVLKIMIQFVFQLKTILGGHWDGTSDWSVLFNYSLFAAQCPQILTAFLTFHHFVFSNTSIVANWSEKVCEAWTWFATGMWYLMKPDAQFCSFCSDFGQCKTLFALPK